MKSNYDIAETNLAPILNESQNIIRKLASERNNWWSNRKKYSRLSETFIRSYIFSKMRDIRLKGNSEADKIIEKMISGKKSDVPKEILNFISENRRSWSDFIYKSVSTLDIDGLIGVFVPLIYGGVMTRKNMSGESFGIIDFNENAGNLSHNERILHAVKTIDGFKRIGISVILIDGSVEEVYSKLLLEAYRNSPNESFFIIEREASKGATNENNGSGTQKHGQRMYERTILTDLSRTKNVFIILDSAESAKKVDQNDQSLIIDEITMSKSRALSSYGILHALSVGTSASGLGLDGEEMCEKDGAAGVRSIFGDNLQKGSAIAVFDKSIYLSQMVDEVIHNSPMISDGVLKQDSGRKITLNSKLSGDISKTIYSIVPKTIMKFIKAPKFPLYLPDIYEIIILTQFILSGGEVRRIRRDCT